MKYKHVLIGFFAYLFIFVFSSNVFAGGYVCEINVTYTSCKAGYYLSSGSCLSCSTSTSGVYTLSDANSTDITDCYLVTAAGQYVATSHGAQVTCSGGWCAGGTTVHYGQIGGREVPQGNNWTCESGATTAYQCTKPITLNKNGGEGTIQGTSGSNSAQITCHYNSECDFGSTTGMVPPSGKIFVGGWGTSASCSTSTKKYTNPSESTYYACLNTCSYSHSTATKASSNVCAGTCDAGYSTSGGSNTGTSASCSGTSCSCSAKSVQCSEGYYLPANSLNCASCDDGYYCPGNTYYYSSSEQGRYSCVSNAGASFTKSDGDRSSVNNCYRDCLFSDFTNNHANVYGVRSGSKYYYNDTQSSNHCVAQCFNGYVSTDGGKTCVACNWTAGQHASAELYEDQGSDQNKCAYNVTCERGYLNNNLINPVYGNAGEATGVLPGCSDSQTYILTYYPGAGATGTAAPFYVTYAADVTIKPANGEGGIGFQKTGATFTHWEPGNTWIGGMSLDPTQQPTTYNVPGNLDLTAQWACNAGYEPGANSSCVQCEGDGSNESAYYKDSMGNFACTSCPEADAEVWGGLYPYSDGNHDSVETCYMPCNITVAHAISVTPVASKAYYSESGSDYPECRYNVLCEDGYYLINGNTMNPSCQPCPTNYSPSGWTKWIGSPEYKSTTPREIIERCYVNASWEGADSLGQYNATTSECHYQQ